MRMENLDSKENFVQQQPSQVIFMFSCHVWHVVKALHTGEGQILGGNAGAVTKEHPSYKGIWAQPWLLDSAQGCGPVRKFRMVP